MTEAWYSLKCSEGRWFAASDPLNSYRGSVGNFHLRAKYSTPRTEVNPLTSAVYRSSTRLNAERVLLHRCIHSGYSVRFIREPIPCGIGDGGTIASDPPDDCASLGKNARIQAPLLRRVVALSNRGADWPPKAEALSTARALYIARSASSSVSPLSSKDGGRVDGGRSVSIAMEQ
jgi:hypothetical protein